jgi:hypothetical protein
MLQFLLDEHISPVIAREVGAKCRGIKIVAFQQWRSGRFMGAGDRVFLPEAKKDGLTLVSYDQKSIRPLLKEWAEQGTHHAGLVFVDQRTIAPHDFGSLIEALSDLWRSERGADWTDRVVFLGRPA